MKAIYTKVLSRRIAKKLGQPITKTERLIESFESIIISELKKKDRVKLQNFGTFYLIHQKSRNIIQIRTKQRRILLDNTIIKFRPSLKIRHQLSRDEDINEKEGRDNATNELPIVVKNLQTQTKAQEPPIIKKNTEESAVDIPVFHPKIPVGSPSPTDDTVKVEEIQAVPVNIKKQQPQPSENKVYQRVSHEQAQKILKKRLAGLAPDKSDSENFLKHRILETTDEGKFFDLAFRDLLRRGEKSLNVYFEENNTICRIISGKTRSKCFKVPEKIAKKFFSHHLEMDELSVPQERFVKLHSNSKMNSGWIICAHCLPLVQGSSVYVKIIKKI